MIFDDEILYCKIDFNNYSEIYVSGNIKNPERYKKLLLIAPNPIDRMTNYSGSGLPFPCADIAFENTPNKHIILSSGVFSVTFLYPNSFYMPNGRDKIISSIFFSLTDANNTTTHIRYELKNINALRTLINRSSRQDPNFYGAKDHLLPIANAEDVMREYARIKLENDVG